MSGTFDITVREQGRCARCGTFGIDSVHHRVLGNRNDNRASNRIGLCGSGTTGCHGWVHANPREARRLGYIVSKYQRDQTTSRPVWYGQPGRTGWYLLDDDHGLTLAA